MGAVFVLFLILGIVSLRKAKALAAKIKDEADIEKEILEYISEKLDLSAADTGLSENASDEERYLVRTEYIQDMVKEKYPETDEAFIEHIVEKAYDDIFG